jgi:hypothetical protein
LPGGTHLNPADWPPLLFLYSFKIIHPPPPPPAPPYQDVASEDLFIPIFDSATFAQSEAYYIRLAEEEAYAIKLSNHNARAHPVVPFGNPSPLMILSCLMLRMNLIGMMLKSMGFTWDTFWWTYFALFKHLKWFYPPTWFRKGPDKPSTPTDTSKQTPKQRKKKLLLLALLVGICKVQAFSHIAPTYECQLR